MKTRRQDDRYKERIQAEKYYHPKLLFNHYLTSSTRIISLARTTRFSGKIIYADAENHSASVFFYR